MKQDKSLILLVDDVDFFLEVEKGYLESTTAEILTARNGLQALEMMSTHRPNLVYLDVNMPVMDGIECCRRIKNDPQLRDIPVVIVYATSRDINDEQVKTSGCDGILHKPIDRNAFLDLGRRFLSQVDRRLQRCPCKIPVDFSFEGKSYRADAVNLSSAGMYLHCPEALAVGSRLRISFSLPGSFEGPVECWGEIAWVNNGFPRKKPDLPQGFGLAFKLLSRQHQQRIEQYLINKTTH